MNLSDAHAFLSASRCLPTPRIANQPKLMKAPKAAIRAKKGSLSSIHYGGADSKRYLNNLWTRPSCSGMIARIPLSFDSNYQPREKLMKLVTEANFLLSNPDTIDESNEADRSYTALANRPKGVIGMRNIFLIVALLAATAVAHPQSEVKPEKSGDMSAEITNHKQAVTILFEECFSQDHIERLPDVIASDYEGSNGQSGPPVFAAIITGIRTYLPDARYTLEDMVAEGDRVAVRWRLEGTQDGPFHGFPATHKHVTTSGMAIFQFKKNRIASSWILNDSLRFMQQIGALPSEIKPPTQPTK